MLHKQLLKFELVADEKKAEIIINPDYIEVVVEGKAFYGQDVTQITMTSGTKFIVKHSFAEVQGKLLNEGTCSIL